MTSAVQEASLIVPPRKIEVDCGVNRQNEFVRKYRKMRW